MQRPIDTDGDGIPDEVELHELGTNPFDKDTDGDGFTDEEEVFVYGTDPTDADSRPGQ